MYNMRVLHKLIHNRKAESGGVVYVLITMMVMMLVGIIVVNSLISSVDTDDFSTEANSTWASTKTNIWLAFGLVAVGIIIAGAVAILSIMRGGGSPI